MGSQPIRTEIQLNLTVLLCFNQEDLTCLTWQPFPRQTKITRRKTISMNGPCTSSNPIVAITDPAMCIAERLNQPTQGEGNMLGGWGEYGEDQILRRRANLFITFMNEVNF